MVQKFVDQLNRLVCSIEHLRPSFCGTDTVEDSIEIVR